ncbi:MAG: type IV secretion system DNA-binding domain-containing protein [Candidatus Kaiserbacteria bacterium]|nr:MAG: type IV secretion system DNA-binding domain-containing protein [Candidatus Kaiserbacteria bacterium]
MHPDHHDDDRRITYFAATHTRGKREMFGIRAEDRGKHIYVIGKTGMGKSTMLENMAIQDIQNGEGIAFIDPHGATAEKLLDFVPHDRVKDVVYFAPFDTDHPIGFNVMEDVGYDKRHLVVSGLMGALKRIWVDAWSARMEYILQNTLLALLEYPDSTLLDVNRMLTNKAFRAAVVEKITDPLVKSFWVEEFASFTDTYTREATPAIQNKVGQFTSNPLIRNIVGQPKSSFDLRKMMDEKKIFIVNLSKGRMGETNAALLGSMLVVKIYLAAMSRADEPSARLKALPRCYFYVDEFQSMMNEAFADILSESRKYKLALTLANQYIEQMEENVRDAVFGNVGTLVCFRVGPFDAEVLKTVFEPTFVAEDLVGLGVGQIYLTLMIDGVGSAPFSAETIPPIEAPPISYRDDCVRSSRELYSRPRSEMEAHVNKRQQEFAMPPKTDKNAGRRPGDRGDRRDGFRPSFRENRPSYHNENRERAPETPHDPAPQAPSVRIVRPEEQRTALRAAIHAARPGEDAPASGSAPAPAVAIRSPADILRARKAAKEARAVAPETSTHTPPVVAQAVSQVRIDVHTHETQKPAPVPLKEEPRIPHTPTSPARPPQPKNRRDGEISHDELQRVLRGSEHADR